jgi:predicted N-acetyltransferase YhbS
MTHLSLEQSGHGPAVDLLLDSVFGPGRFAKTVYRLREGVEPLADLNYVALDDAGTVIGTIRYWPVVIGDGYQAIMLGPLAVNASDRTHGLGLKLMDISLAKAKAMGHQRCVLVGDEPYYAKVGFSRRLALGLSVPGPVELSRLLALDLVPGAMDGISGMIQRAALDHPVAAASTSFAPPRQR